MKYLVAIIKNCDWKCCAGVVVATRSNGTESNSRSVASLLIQHNRSHIDRCLYRDKN